MRGDGVAFLFLAGSLLGQQFSIDRLLAEPERSDLQWNVSISAPALTGFQRIAGRITVRIDGKEIVQRAGQGTLVVVAEIRDSNDRPYRTRHAVDLREFENATSRNELQTVLHVFLLPGVYKVSLAAIELATRKISLTHRTLRAAALNRDPLPGAWRDLPPVEFFEMPDIPDRWFLPGNPAQLRLKTEKPARMRIVANISPSLERRRQRRAFEANMYAIVPALKVLAQIELSGGSREIAVLDVIRRRVSYDAPGLDWPALKQALEQSSPNMIDAAALKDRDRDAQFFAAEVARRAAAQQGERPVVIVLSAPLAFISHQEVHPPDIPSGARVFYLRFQTVIMGRFAAGAPVVSAIPADDLQGALKPLQPRVIDIFSPADFRKALAAILKEIEQ